MARVIAIPDLHFPYTDLEALTLLYAEIEKEQPDIIVQLGDSLDMYSFSKFPRSHNLMTPRQELETGIEMLEEFWRLIHKVSPSSQKYMLLGNHEERLPKRVLERLPEAEGLFDLKELMTFDGVETVTDEILEIDEVIYIHGFLTREYAHLRYFLRSVVFGHTHRAWCLFEKISRLTEGRTPHKNGLLFEMSCGYLADDSQIPLQYTASKINKWSKGYGKIYHGDPSFKPL